MLAHILCDLYIYFAEHVRTWSETGGVANKNNAGSECIDMLTLVLI